MVEIKHGSYMDYVFLFGDSRTIHTDLIVKETLHGEDKWFLIAYKNEKPAGYLCASREGRLVKVLYVYTQETLRGQGIFHALMEYLIQSTKYTIMMNITQDNPYYHVVESVCHTLQFKEDSAYILYHSEVEKLSAWDDFMKEKGNALVKLLERWGFSAISLAESPKKIVEQLYNSKENQYQNLLDVRHFFDGENKFVNRELSFVAIKGGELAAYCLVTSRDGVSVVYEQFSVAEKYLGSGVILLPYAKSMEVCKSTGVKKACFAISETNRRSNLFYEKVLDRINTTKTKSINYILSR